MTGCDFNEISVKHPTTPLKFNGVYHIVLYQSCEILPGVGPVLLKKLLKCGIKTNADLLLHLPYRYQDRTRITPIKHTRDREYAVISGTIVKTEVTHGTKRMLHCYVEDKTGVVRLRFFHFNADQITKLSPNTWLRAFGEIRVFANQIEIIHPEYTLLDHENTVTMEENLTPIYALTEGLTQNRLRQIIKLALNRFKPLLREMEWLSQSALHQLNFPVFADALALLHNPPPSLALATLEGGQHPAYQRLAFDELLAQRLSMQFAREHLSTHQAAAMPFNDALLQRYLAQLPFPLTQAQQRVSHEISRDLQKTKPMLRLVQGDVGCGKTVVATIAALQAINAGFQVAFMAPTDLLTEQHFINMQRWLAPLHLVCCRLSGQMKAKEKRETLRLLAANECHLIIGTHALFQAGVTFHNLGLSIIDEQHRFGVEQRIQLQQKSSAMHSAHQLLMTATPIPRSLAMTQFAHLDLSTIDQLPPGRTPVNTVVLAQAKREPIIERLKQSLAEGCQVYWVCPLIEESEKLECAAATLTAETLQALLSNYRVGLIHGRMKSREKEETMLAFKQKDINLLVATTVIEVGVDVPNASVMIVENAERLGLSQLHQLRGRVGRGSAQSHCLLLYQTPLSSMARERLQVMRATSDGFVIAEKDLQLRGSGEILGTKQTGYRPFKIADLQRDQHLLPLITTHAKQLYENDKNRAKEITVRWLGDYEHYLKG